MYRSLASLAVALVLNTSAFAQGSPAIPEQINVAFAGEAATMDPLKYAGGIDREFLSQIYELLVKPDPSLKKTNWLAESWDIAGTPEKPIIEVKLRPGIKFHNGYPLTSADFEFSYQRARDPKVSRWTHLQAAVERFEIVDDLRFRIHFKQPDAQYVAENLTLWAISKRYFEEVGETEFEQKPIGTGPWKFVSRTRGSELKLEAFADYWNKEHRPRAKFLSIKVIPEDSTRVAAFQTGAVDWISTVPSQSLDTIKKIPGVKTVTKTSGGHLTIQFAMQIANSPFKDLRVRKAVAHAIDWKSIISKVLFEQGEPYAEFSREDFGFDPSIKPYAYDPKKSRELLKEAGFAKGFETNCYNLLTPREPNFKEMGEAVFAYLGAVGIRCKIQGLEYNAWLTTARRGREAGQEMNGLLMFTWGVGVPGDMGRAWLGMAHSYVPGTSLGLYSYTNDAKLDDMVQRQNKIMDADKRRDLLREIARYKYDNILGGLTTYVPLKTFAWRGDKLEFTAWPWPGNWHEMLELKAK
jgi:peptide/nickel transport system substrate-binding protein